MKKSDAIPYVSRYVDDALSPEPFDTAIPLVVLVGWQCGFEPLFVAVRSYLPDTVIDDDEAVDLATDLLDESEWFSNGPTEPDYIIR
tara:strand:- start:5022 stop:5282 length:261 start_codon:yes stop_codon:yes gene_type:complete